MRLPDLIAKKKNGRAHSPEEIEFIARAAADGSVPDYQLSAWLMAVCWRGMGEAEAAGLTRAMASSGRSLRLRELGLPAVDKHSTGGVGDGISICLAPLVASAGIVVPMMSGRGLGHTGGTLDKLESIPGFKVRLTVDEITAQLRQLGACMFGQSEEIAPADRRLYALRDATATVDCTPLIVASILSKKLAEDLDGLVLDIKSGSGAIFADARAAENLGRALVSAARKLGLPCVGLLTGMDQPLGLAVGNALEVRQAVAVLKGDQRAADYVELLLTLGGWMLQLAGKARRWEEGARRLRELIDGGQALEKFRNLVVAQGGDARVVDEPERLLPSSARHLEVRAPKSGFVSRLDARLVGEAAVALGAGRDRMEDSIDPGAGILLERKIGDRVEKNEIVATLYASDARRLERAEPIFLSALGVAARKPKDEPIVRKVLK